MTDRDIRFTEKKVDDGWKEQVLKDKGAAQVPQSQNTASQSPQNAKPAPDQKRKASSPIFYNFLNSLAIQVLMNLGEMPQGAGMGPGEVNLDAAREILDLLVVLKEKTEGNLGPEESQYFMTALPELQLKFSHHV